MTVKEIIIFARLADETIIEVITVEQASELAQKSLATIYNWIKQNKFQTIEGGNQTYVIKFSFLKYLSTKGEK